jgi:hypothetical protein
LTLPDVEGALAEAMYALDELHADGIVLLANSDGRYLGDPDFAPLLDFLHRRSVAVFVHPGERLPVRSGAGDRLPQPAVRGVPAEQLVAGGDRSRQLGGAVPAPEGMMPS